MCGCYTSQKFLGSMEGAVLAGKLAAEVISDRAAYGGPTKGLKKVTDDVLADCVDCPPRAHKGLLLDSDSAIVYGGGATLDLAGSSTTTLKEQDPVQLEVASA